MWRFIKWTVVILLLAAVLVTGGIFFQGYQLYQKTMADVSLEDVITTYQADDNYVVIDDLPSTFLNAVIAVEDHRFMEHHGFDPISFGRAIIRNVQESEFAAGGSTITQQLAKNLFFSFEKKLDRKVAELMVAWQMEETFSKSTILEMYVNIIYFGDGYEGINAASMGYFNKAPSQLTDAESILLAGLPQAPSVYALKEHFEMGLKRSEAVIDAMIEYGYLMADEKETLLRTIEQIKIQVE